MSPGFFPHRAALLRQACGGLCGLLPLLLALTGRGHDILAGFLQHQVVLSLGAEHLDVTVHLTFFEDGSEHERVHMDEDQDGRLSREETWAHLKRLEPELARAVSLRAAGKAVALIPLREPELDLLGSARTGRWHHRLSLYYFAATPADLAAGTELVVEDRLWPTLRAVGLFHVSGRDGARLEAVPLPDAWLPPARHEEPRLFKARVVVPPRPPPDPPRPAGSSF